MRQVIQIPEGLNKKETSLYRSLMRSSEKNIDKRWVYNNVKDIIGYKKTNSMTGETKVTFDYVPKEAFTTERSSVSAVTEELEKIKKSLDLKIEEMEKECEDLRAKSDKIDIALVTLEEIKGVHEKF